MDQRQIQTIHERKRKPTIRDRRKSPLPMLSPGKIICTKTHKTRIPTDKKIAKTYFISIFPLSIAAKVSVLPFYHDLFGAYSAQPRLKYVPSLRNFKERRKRKGNVSKHWKNWCKKFQTLERILPSIGKMERRFSNVWKK